MALPETLGSYQVERELGRGGMGVVYLGRDPRLNRLVAIKIVPETLAKNPDNLARFEREAKLLAAVNHPNIAAIYGVEEIAGSHGFLLVMEYVPGDTLAERLARGPLPVPEALDVARQIALAIEAAHEGGIVHRDLKPGNVKVTPEGVVKVLDFGLAKGGSASSADMAQSPTLTYSPTGIGVILGTAGYMSPEQARGKTVDRRADIWAFGCVLFECLTARKTFEGETVSDTIARIIEREPDWDALPPATPPAVRELLRRCLEKDVRKRQRDIGDVRLDLEGAIAARSGMSSVSSSVASRATSASPRPVWRAWGVPVLTTLVGVAAGILLWSQFGPPGTTSLTEAPHLSIAVPANIRFSYASFLDVGHDVIVSGHPKRPDGSEDPRARLYLRRLASFEFKEIPGTEGVNSWTLSPGARSIALVKPVSEQSGDSRLVRVPVDGSSPAVTISEWGRDWSDLRWLADGDLLIMTTQATRFFRLPSGGGSPKQAVAFDFGGAGGYPDFSLELPGGRGLLVEFEAFGPEGYQQDIYVVDPNTGKGTRVLENGWSPYYDPVSRHLFFSRRGTIHAVPFDLATLTAGREPIALLEGLRASGWSNGYYDVAGDGTLGFVSGGQVGTDRRIVIVESGRPATLFLPDARAFEEHLGLSRDGRQVAVVIANARGTYELWTATSDRPGLRRTIAITNADCTYPVWSPDGRWLAFVRSGRDKDDGVYLMRSDGTGDQVPVLKTAVDQWAGPTSWLPDGSGLLITRVLGGRFEPLLVRVQLEPQVSSTAVKVSPPELMRDGKNSTGAVALSPDGTLAAFIADDSGRPEIWVAPVVAGRIGGQPIPIGSTGGLDEIRWAADNRRVYYRNDDDRIMTTTIDRAPSLRATKPTLAYDLKALRLVEDGTWAVMPDGRLVGLQLGMGEGDIRSYSIVLNWLEAARRKLGR